MSVDLVRATSRVECTACPFPIAAGDPCALGELGYSHILCALEPLTVSWCASCGHETAHQNTPTGLACASSTHPQAAS